MAGVERRKNMIRTDERNIKSIAAMSNNDEYRYRLTRIWDEKKEIIGIIMLNPSMANVIKTDKTIMNICNYLIDNEYGGVDVVNLFSYMTTDKKYLKNRNHEYEKYNDEYITKVVNDRCMTIIAWGSNTGEYKNRKKDVENLLIPYRNKLKCFRNENKKLVCHPLLLNNKWKLVDYPFFYIK